MEGTGVSGNGPFFFERKIMAQIMKKNRRVKARSRDQARNTYRDYQLKDEMKTDMSYARVNEMYSTFYAGVDPRRKQELADGGMVQEDPNAMSNLSPVGYQRQYPRAGYYSTPYIDDSVEE